MIPFWGGESSRVVKICKVSVKKGFTDSLFFCLGGKRSFFSDVSLCQIEVWDVLLLTRRSLFVL